MDKMRTSRGIAAELKKIDPDTPIGRHAIDVWAKSGLVISATVGNRRYISLDSVLEFLTGSKEEPPQTAAQKNYIRRIDV